MKDFMFPPKVEVDEDTVELYDGLDEGDIVKRIMETKLLREKHSIPQYKIARRARLNQSTVSRVERLAEVPTAKLMAKYIAAVIAEVEDLPKKGNKNEPK